MEIELPTPIGPPSGIQIVDQIPLTETVDKLLSYWSKKVGDPNLLWECLRPLLTIEVNDELSVDIVPSQKYYSNDEIGMTRRAQRWAQASSIDWHESYRQNNYNNTDDVQGSRLRFFEVDDDDLLQEQGTTSSGVARSQQEDQRKPEAKNNLGDDPENPQRSVKVRSHQALLWNHRLKELGEYKAMYGTCHVPHDWKGSPDWKGTTSPASLSKWVKRQRYQYKLKQEGKRTTLTQDREDALERLGFVWQSHASVWDERFEELKAFQKVHGHCIVPVEYVLNPQLPVWVQCQRRQCRIFRNGGARSFITEERIQKLDSIGFVWEPRGERGGGEGNTDSEVKDQRKMPPQPDRDREDDNNNMF